MEFNGSDGQLLKANVISSGALLLALGTSVIQASQFVNVDFQVPFVFFNRISLLAHASPHRENITAYYVTLKW